MPIPDRWASGGQAPASDAAIAARLVEVARAAVAELRGGDPQDCPVSLDSTLQGDLGLDSLGRVELLHHVEQAFDLRFRDQVFQSAASLGDILAAIIRYRPRAATDQVAASPAASPASAGQAPDKALTLIDVLRWHVERRAAATAITLIEPDGERPVTYADLWRAAAAVCGALQARGIAAGESIALMLPTGADYFAAFMGVLLSGCVPVPIYPPAQAAQLEEHIRRHAKLLDNARVVLMLTDRSVHRLGRLLQANVPRLRHVVNVADLAGDAGDAGSSLITAVDADALALLQYTSGSTGEPKGVMLTHRQLLANIRTMGRTIRVDGADRFVSWLPLYHDMGLIGAWFGTMYFGVPLAIMTPLAFLTRPERWLWAIHRHRATLSAAPNFAYGLCLTRIADADLQGLDLSCWRVAFNGAEAVLPDTIERFCERFGKYGFRREAMTPVYGLAECAVGLAFPPLARGPLIDRVAREACMRSGECRPAAADDPNPLRFVGCGTPLPGYEVRIVDASGREAGERQEGRLEFRGPSATAGYFNNPAATARLMRAGWLDSGDRAYVAGGEIFVTGRIKDIIIRNGRHVHPDELEAAVGTVEGVRRGCVAVFGTRRAGAASERLVVMAETHRVDTQLRAALVANITARIVETLGEPPDEVVLVPPHAVLKTSSGKIRRAASRAAYESGSHLAGRRALGWQALRLAAVSIPPMAARVVRSAGGVAYAAWFWVVVCLAGAATCLLVALVPYRRWASALARAGARFILAAVGLRPAVHGGEHVPPAGPCVIVPNHSSYLDGLVVLGTVRRECCFVAKRELQEQWLPRLFLARIGALFVARDETLQSVASAAAMAAAVQAGKALVVFAEGTFTRAPGLLPFHLGGFVAAATAHAPTVPMAMRGTRSALRDGQWFPIRTPLALDIGPPIPAPAGLQPLAAALAIRAVARAYISAHCGEPDARLAPATQAHGAAIRSP